MQTDSRFNHVWWTLRIGLGLMPLFAGLDKFLNLLTNWEMYLNPIIPRVLHISPVGFMHIVGVIEIIAGLLVFSRFVRYAGYVVMAWLVAIALTLVAQGQFLDVAVRDIELSLGAFALAKLSEIRQTAQVESLAPLGRNETHPAQRMA
jgi:uncharacterized membrane protein YphA (DoxX/SURF4 family)